MTAVERASGTEVTLSAVPTVDELLAIVRAEDKQVALALKSAVIHAVRCGEALLEIRHRMEWGEWIPWADAHLPWGYTRANRYMRLAFYKAHLPPEAFDGTRSVDTLSGAGGRRATLEVSVSHAYGFLRGLPPLPHGKGSRVDRDFDREQAEGLRAAGLSNRKIATKLGVSKTYVAYIMDPALYKAINDRSLARARRNQAGQRALAEKQRLADQARIAKDVGGPLSVAYSDLRRCLSSLDKAIGASASEGERGALHEAVSRAHRLETTIVTALRMARQGGTS